jgi:hypothetical protein
VPGPDRHHRGARLTWLAVAAAFAAGTVLLVRGAPGQAGVRPPQAATPVAVAPAGAGCPDRPGVPVKVTVDGAHAQRTPVEAHGLDGGSLYVPQDPRVASWLAYPAVGPGADHGTAVLTGHVNYAHVPGAFSDLTAYRPGQRITVTLADGRVITYHVVPAAVMGFDTTATALQVGKATLDADRALDARIFDFTSAWREAGGPSCGRLVIVTCSGRVVEHDYQDNAFVFALPDP